MGSLKSLESTAKPSPSSSMASGQLNVRMGLLMVVAALILGILLEQYSPTPDPLPPAPGTEIDWRTIPVEYYAWKLCYAHLGNMGILNIAGGAVLLFLGPHVLGHRLLAHTLLLGGLLHPGAWALVGLTGLEIWRWLGRGGAIAVLLVLLVLVAQVSLARLAKRRTEIP